MSRKPWYKDGLKFQCQSSGNCCVSRGEYGFVYLTLEDRIRMAKHLKVTLHRFEQDYCQKSDDFYHLKEDPERPECHFLKENKCSIYQARPTQCRTWPFWPENMSARAWKKEVAAFCPGVGKGHKIDFDKIQKTIELQSSAEDSM